MEQPLAETIWRKCTDTDQGRALGDAIHGQMQGKQELLAGLHLLERDDVGVLEPLHHGHLALDVLAHAARLDLGLVHDLDGNALLRFGVDGFLDLAIGGGGAEMSA